MTWLVCGLHLNCYFIWFLLAVEQSLLLSGLPTPFPMFAVTWVVTGSPSLFLIPRGTPG